MRVASGFIEAFVTYKGEATWGCWYSLSMAHEGCPAQSYMKPEATYLVLAIEAIFGRQDRFSLKGLWSLAVHPGVTRLKLLLRNGSELCRCRITQLVTQTLLGRHRNLFVSCATDSNGDEQAEAVTRAGLRPGGLGLT